MFNLSKNSVEINKYKDEIETLKNVILEHVREGKRFRDTVEDEAEQRIRDINLDAERLIESKRVEIKEEIESKTSSKIQELENKIQNLNEEYLSTSGKYEACIEIIKSLKEQIASLTKSNEQLIGKLPSVSANIKSADNNVSILK